MYRHDCQVADTHCPSQLSLFIFPEGTRSSSPVPSMLPFKKGPFHLAVAAQLPIVPIVCENYAPLYSSQRKYFESGDLVIKGKPLPRSRRGCATPGSQADPPTSRAQSCRRYRPRA